MSAVVKPSVGTFMYRFSADAPLNIESSKLHAQHDQPQLRPW